MGHLTKITEVIVDIGNSDFSRKEGKEEGKEVEGVAVFLAGLPGWDEYVDSEFNMIHKIENSGRTGKLPFAFITFTLPLCVTQCLLLLFLILPLLLFLLSFFSEMSNPPDFSDILSFDDGHGKLIFNCLSDNDQERKLQEQNLLKWKFPKISQILAVDGLAEKNQQRNSDEVPLGQEITKKLSQVTQNVDSIVCCFFRSSFTL